MLDSKDLKEYIEKLARKMSDETVNNAVIVHGFKVISSLFSMLASIKNDYSLNSIGHGFGVLITTFERVPPVQAVNRREDKANIMNARSNMASLLEYLGNSLDGIMSGDSGLFLELARTMYKNVNEIDRLANHFVSFLPPIQA